MARRRRNATWPKYGSKKYTSGGGNPHLRAGGWTYYPDRVYPYWLSDAFEHTAFYTHEDDAEGLDHATIDMNHEAFGNAPKGSFNVTFPNVEGAYVYRSMSDALNAMISGGAALGGPDQETVDAGIGKVFRAPPRKPTVKWSKATRTSRKGDVRTMSADQLCAVGDKACRAELKRRGRSPETGLKISKKRR